MNAVWFVVFLGVVGLCECSDPTFLPNWMGRLMPAIQNQTLLDLSLPGTHDTFTYDLSGTVSDGGIDDDPTLAKIMHTFSKVIPTSFIKDQAVCQNLNITEQLDAGMRFLDVRMMFTSGDWYALHFLQTKNKVMTYLNQIHNWMIAHPSEIIVMWLSKHGAPNKVGNDQYPGVSISKKQAFWGKIHGLFADMIFNPTNNSLNVTTIARLVRTNQRVVVLASDWAEFTNSSQFALDTRVHLDNQLNPSDEPTALKWEVSYYSTAASKKAAAKLNNKFLLVSLCSSAPGDATTLQAEINYVPLEKDKHKKQCAKLYSIPNMTSYCPMSLMEVNRLSNYYTQTAFDMALAQSSWDFPNAFYMNGVYKDGTLYIANDNSKLYGYADAILTKNVQRGCQVAQPAAECTVLESLMLSRRQVYPKQTWTDNKHGRLASWPTP